MSNPAKTLATLALILAIPTFGQGRRGQPPRGGGGLYDPAAYSAGLRAAEEGDMIGALEGFCDMLSPSRGQNLWTVSVVLLCEASEVPMALRAIQDPQPVFVVKRVFEGRTCFRVCAGLTTDRREAVGMRVRLPEAFKDAGPFPVEVSFPCDPSLPGFERPPKPEAGIPAAEEAGRTEPEVVELTPVPPPPLPWHPCRPLRRRCPRFPPPRHPPSSSPD